MEKRVTMLRFFGFYKIFMKFVHFYTTLQLKKNCKFSLQKTEKYRTVDKVWKSHEGNHPTILR